MVPLPCRMLILAPTRAKISILQGEEREMFDCNPSCSRHESEKLMNFSADYRPFWPKSAENAESAEDAHPWLSQACRFC